MQLATHGEQPRPADPAMHISNAQLYAAQVSDGSKLSDSNFRYGGPGAGGWFGGSKCPSVPELVPGGLWISPEDKTQVTESRIHLTARAYPTNPGDPAIHHVNFTASWPPDGAYKTVCSQGTPTHNDALRV